MKRYHVRAPPGRISHTKTVMQPTTVASPEPGKMQRADIT